MLFQTTSLNKYLSELMDGLTAKVFRTYNASMTLQDQLNQLTKSEDNVNAKILTYNRANRAVAILCNHQVSHHDIEYSLSLSFLRAGRQSTRRCPS